MREHSSVDAPVLGGRSLPRRLAITMAVLFLVPPGAWLASIGASYVVEDFVCTAAASADADPPVTAVTAVVIVLNVVLLLATAASAWLAHRARRRATNAPAPVPFLAWTTTASAALFGYGIVLIGTTVAVLPVCS